MIDVAPEQDFSDSVSVVTPVNPGIKGVAETCYKEA